MREIRMLRSRWRELETGPRPELTGARHARKGGHRRSRDLRDTAPALDPASRAGLYRRSPTPDAPVAALGS